jgi:hypothetical protein
LANESDEQRRRENAQADDGPARRPKYVSPELIEYGTVAKLTQTGGSTQADALVWRRMGTCL